MEVVEKKRFKVSRWIFFSLAVLTNAFLIVYSTIPADIAKSWNAFFTNIFVGFINNITEKEVETIPITELSTYLTNDKYNDIPGYSKNQIPLGSAKQIGFSFSPSNATDKSVQYYAEQTDLVSLNQSGDLVSVVGMKAGIATIHAKNKLSGLDETVVVEVVNTVAPVNFDASIDSYTIPMGSQQTINFDIDGGVLGHNELINFRYYDIRKLTYTSSDESVAMVDENAVIYPIGIGEATITVSNSVGIEESFEINVVSGTSPTPYSNLIIEGSSICYDNDMIKDQQTGTNHYQLSIKDGDDVLDPKDFIWESSNELLVKVDRHGVMRGFRKSVVEDETATITATSKITGQSANFEVTIKEQLPTKLSYSIVNGKTTVWNYTDYSACVGDNLIVQLYYEPNISQKSVIATSSDENIIQITNQGSSLSLQLKAEGSCLINVASIVNPSLKFEVKITVLKAGALSGEDYEDLRVSIRKIVGHASLFMFASIFTIITCYMFLYNKKTKYWLPILITLGFELLISGLSEMSQGLIPGRNGTVKDVFINFAGAAVGVSMVILVFVIIKLTKNRKNKKQTNKQ